jgi:hypothetical protein
MVELQRRVGKEKGPGMIPDEAVQAGCESLGDAVSYSDVRAILESVAPYIRAAHIWDSAKTEMREK